MYFSCFSFHIVFNIRRLATVNWLELINLFSVFVSILVPSIIRLFGCVPNSRELYF